MSYSGLHIEYVYVIKINASCNNDEVIARIVKQLEVKKNVTISYVGNIKFFSEQIMHILY